MLWKKRFAVVAVLFLSGFALVASGKGAAMLRDLWIHPRGAVYDPALHYKAPDGELFFHAENDLGKGLEAIVIHAGSDPRVSAELGADLWSFLEKHGGSPRAGGALRLERRRPRGPHAARRDREPDRRLREPAGRADRLAEPPLADGDPLPGRGERVALPTTAATWPRSTARSARVRFPRVDDLPRRERGAGSADAGLVIFEHREGQPFDLVQMARQPASTWRTSRSSPRRRTPTTGP